MFLAISDHWVLQCYWSDCAAQDLHRRVVTIREIYENQIKEGKSGRLRQDDEKLMFEVFRHHPRAVEKLKGVQYIQVGQTAKSNDPNHHGFLVMRNEEDGDDISYVKCLRCLADQENGRHGTESVLSIATVSFDQHGLKVEVGGGDALVLDTDPPQSTSAVGIRVELEKKVISLHSATKEYGPYGLGKAARLNVSGVPLWIKRCCIVNLPVQENLFSGFCKKADLECKQTVCRKPNCISLYLRHFLNVSRTPRSCIFICSSNVRGPSWKPSYESGSFDISAFSAQELSIADRGSAPLTLLVDVPGESIISWDKPFRCFPHTRLMLV